MRPYFIKTTVALALFAPLVASGSSTADWNGSYSANGQCFCAGTVSSAVGNSIVPTPIGGQTVAQVCQRIGAGPNLKFQGDRYNYPVYKDSQCGHGPFEAGSSRGDESCLGSMDGKSADSDSCQPIGPRWDVKQAFSKQGANKKLAETEQSSNSKGAVKVQTRSSVEKNSSDGLVNQPVVTSISVKRADSIKGESKTLKATVINSA